MLPIFLLMVVPLILGFALAFVTSRRIGMEKTYRRPALSVGGGGLSAAIVERYYTSQSAEIFIAFSLGCFLGLVGWILFCALMPTTEEV